MTLQPGPGYYIDSKKSGHTLNAGQFEMLLQGNENIDKSLSTA